MDYYIGFKTGWRFWGYTIAAFVSGFGFGMFFASAWIQYWEK